MKIKLAILENDKIYLQRIVASFNMKYSDKLEIYSFTDPEIAISALTNNKIEVLLVNEAIEIDAMRLPTRCALAYLVDSADIESVRNETAIFKFQNAELIYKQILSVFSEKASSITGLHFDENETGAIIAFLSPAGGCGSSTAAAACALSFAAKNKKTLYINLEKLGSSDTFFSAEGAGDFSDLIYAIKSKKANLPLKLESTVKQDESGVYFYSSTKLALDMAELSTEEIKRLVNDLRMYGGYDYVILDMDFSLDSNTLDVLNVCSRFVLVSDGSEISNGKLLRAIDSLGIIEQQSDYKLLLRCFILYNRVSSHNSSQLDIPDLRVLGGIKRYEGFSVKQLMRELAANQVFEFLLRGEA